MWKRRASKNKKVEKEKNVEPLHNRRRRDKNPICIEMGKQWKMENISRSDTANIQIHDLPYESVQSHVKRAVCLYVIAK